MNFAFAMFSGLLLFNAELFPNPMQWALFFVVFGAAHAGQWGCNVPIALKNLRDGAGICPVLQGPMRTMFVVDGSLMICNWAAGGFLATR